MRRPFAVFGFTLLFASAAIQITDSKATGTVFFIALAAFAAFMGIPACRRNKTLPTAAGAVALSCILLFAANAKTAEPALSLNGRECTVSGSLYTPEYTDNGYTKFILKTDTVDGRPLKIKILFGVYGGGMPDADATDRLTVRITPYALGGDNTAYAYLYTSESVFAGAQTGEILKIEKGVHKTVGAYLLNLRRSMLRAIRLYLPNDAGSVLCGILLGETDSLSVRVRHSLTVCGAGHLLAVSGLHITTWAFFAERLLLSLGVRRKRVSGFVMGFVLLFMVLTGMQPSVIRAGGMLLLVFAGGFFKREADSLNSIGVAVSAMLIFSPFLALSMGLWLSVLASVGIIVLSPKIKTVFTRGRKKQKTGMLHAAISFVTESASVTLSAVLFTLPVSMIFGAALSAVAVLSNLLLLTAGTASMIAAGFSAILLTLGAETLGVPILWFGGLAAEYILKMTARLSQFRYALIPLQTHEMHVFVAVLLILSAVLVLAVRKQKFLFRLFAAVLTVVVAGASVFALYADSHRLRLCVTDVGGGMCVVMRYEGHIAILGCGGERLSAYRICDILSLYGGANVDFILLPQGNEALQSAANYILERYPVARIYAAEPKAAEGIIGFGGAVTRASAMRISLFDGRVQLNYRTDRNGSFADIYYQGFRARIVFDPNTDFAAMGKEKASFSLLISRQAIPEGLDLADCRLAILSASRPERGAIALKKFPNVLTTAENGSISVTAYESGAFQYERVL